MSKWNFAMVGSFFKNSFSAILKGEFLMRLHINDYFLHIVYTFLIFVVAIWVSLMVENSMVKVEQNRRIINELNTQKSILEYKLSEIERSTDLAIRLDALGSKVTEPEKPAVTIKR